MKKSIRIIALITAMLLIALSLCSCRSLDELRGNTAIYDDDAKETLTFRGEQYRIISGKNDLTISSAITQWGHATAPDVPVLLATAYGDEMWFEDNEEHTAPLILYVNHYDSDRKSVNYVTDKVTTVFYCQESFYDKLYEKMNAEKLDHYTVDYYDNDALDRYYETLKADEAINDEQFHTKEVLDEETTEAIDRTLANKDILMHEDVPETKLYELTLNVTDEDMLVTNNHIIEVYEHDGEYFLSENNMYYNHIVAEEDIPIFEKLHDTYKVGFERAYK